MRLLVYERMRRYVLQANDAGTAFSARGISEAAALRVATALPSADMPVVTIPYRPRLVDAPTRDVVFVPQEQEKGGLLKKIAEHHLLDLVTKLVALIMVAYAVADHHPQIFAWAIDQLLQAAEQLLQCMD